MQIFQISPFISAKSTADYFDSIENLVGDIKETICEDPDKLYSRILSECFHETNLYKYKRAFKECYVGIEVVNGKKLYDWICSHTDESAEKADKCIEEKINQQAGEDTFSELTYDVMNCTISKLPSEDYKRK
ncbi:hypothetical protein HNY73_011862 [Argiope bruennichi]|uniref:Uncharacterized protein n=2 Tax=Argiope bruennichi TaxID=94029 RepID=A0A8T0EUN7_ARGBR|nr:hypothetical protein HNY73_011862 [Argiope bruennichi]